MNPAEPSATPTALAGLAAFVNKARPGDCHLIGAPMIQWLEGYRFAAETEFSRNGAESPRFHVERPPRANERWTHAEIKFLDMAWPSTLPASIIAALLARPLVAVRRAAHLLRLKRAGAGAPARSERSAAHA